MPSPEPPPLPGLRPADIAVVLSLVLACLGVAWWYQERV
jgi:hypothetical protein